MNFSKVMVKDPITKEISPLYCDINLTLTPATMYSNNSLEKFIEGYKNICNPKWGVDSSKYNHTDGLRKQQEYLKRNYNV